MDGLDRARAADRRWSAARAVSGVWLSRYAVAVHRLTRGIGDTVFYGADGQPWFRLDEQRHDVSLDEIAADLQHAVVAVEDRRFYHHPGIDPIGLGRAVVRDVRGGARMEGGSTLTQQLARTLFLSNVKTFGRKIKEGGIALLIEAQLSKKQILEFYLNRVYLSAGVYGVETMSQHLFRKPARGGHAARGGVHRRADSRAVRAVAVVQLRRRARAQPCRAGADARAGADHGAAGRGRAAGAARASSRTASRTTCAPASRRNSCVSSSATSSAATIRRTGRCTPTFLPAVQDAAERAVAGGLDRLRRPGLEAALVAIDPSTGDILAMVGGANYARSTYNRAVRSRRQPGSAFKPLVYAAALANGYSPVSVLTNLRHVSAPGDPEWSPRSEGEQPDALTLRAALLESNNPAAADLQQRVGSRAVLQLAGDAGLERPARRAVARARHRRGLAARSHRRPTRCFPATARWRVRAG